jgi:alpha-glucosidase
MWKNFIYLIPLLGTAVVADVTDNCPGYKVSHVQETQGTITADLTLAGSPCNVYGTDIENLKLIVEYQTGKMNNQHPNPMYRSHAD